MDYGLCFLKELVELWPWPWSICALMYLILKKRIKIVIKLNPGVKD